MKLNYKKFLTIFFFIYILIIPCRILADGQFSKFIITPEEAMLLNLSDTDWEKWKSLSPGAGIDSETPEMERQGKIPPLGPIIIIHKPQYVNDDIEDPILHSNSPLHLLIIFQKNEAPVNIGSLDIWAEKGIIKKTLTDRLASYISGDTLNAESVKCPPGRFLIGISISDADGRETRKKYRLVITNDTK